MARYIDVETLKNDGHTCWHDGEGNIYYEVDHAPTADVAEVKHGKWIDLNITEWQCSECNYRVERWNNTPYCPDCGAKMDGTPKERGGEK